MTAEGWVCAGCEDRMPAEEAPRPGALGALCEGCWEDELAVGEGDVWYEAEPYEGEGEGDLIGSQWYHEDLP